MSGEVEASQAELDMKALEDFWVGNEDLDRLEAFLDRFNIFEVIGMAHQELRHSRLLAYLLDPRKDHGLGDLLVKRLLQRVLSTANSGQAETMVPVSPAELESWDLTRATVNREWHHVDILIRDQEHRLVVIIENKIRSGERPGQLRRYLDVVRRHYPGWRVVPLFLTLDGLPPSEETYLAVDYGLVCEVLDAVVKTRAEGVNPDVKTLMAHYTGMMRRRFLGDKRITELVSRIHQRHGRAIDLINRYRPDTQTDLVAELGALVDEEPGLVADQIDKNRIRFSVEGWDVPALLTAKAFTPSRRVLLFEFFNKPRDLQLNLMVGPGNDEDVRQGLFGMAAANPEVLSRPRRPEGDWGVIYNRHFLDERLYGPDVSEAERTEVIRARWAEFLNEDLPRIDAALKEERWIWESDEPQG